MKLICQLDDKEDSFESDTDNFNQNDIDKGNLIEKISLKLCLRLHNVSCMFQECFTHLSCVILVSFMLDSCILHGWLLDKINQKIQYTPNGYFEIIIKNKSVQYTIRRTVP